MAETGQHENYRREIEHMAQRSQLHALNLRVVLRVASFSDTNHDWVLANGKQSNTAACFKSRTCYSTVVH